MMERLCEVQIMVESTGIAKRYIGHEEADFTAKINADPVYSLNIKHSITSTVC